MMLSILIPCFNEKDLLVFDSEIRAFLKDSAPLQYVVEPRITAVEVLLIYESAADKGLHCTAHSDNPPQELAPRLLERILRLSASQ